jgi:hypothetical protein
MKKRDFLRTTAGAGLGLLFGEELWAQYSAVPVARLAEDEAFWAAIRDSYRLKPDSINLENGYYSIQAQPVLEAFIARVREQNYQGSYACARPRSRTRPPSATGSLPWQAASRAS